MEDETHEYSANRLLIMYGETIKMIRLRNLTLSHSERNNITKHFVKKEFLNK